MGIQSAEPEVYLVPLIDVNWLVYAPFDPGRDFRVDPPKVDQSIGETRDLHKIMKARVGSKYILTPHSGTYCRTGYYEGEMLDVYREAAADGAELAVHLHEEIKGQGTRYHEDDHVRAMFLDCKHRLEAAGVTPVAYRGGHYAYTPFMNVLLPENDIFIDCSCAPTMTEPSREAIWTHADTTGHYLGRDPRKVAAGQPPSKVFEIPIGADGEGAAYRNLLHVEQSDFDNLARIWSVIRERARRGGQAQIVHSLFHTGSMGREEWVDRFKRFLDFVPDNGGRFVTTVEAKSIFDARRLEDVA